jgi:hypothetical protein
VSLAAQEQALGLQDPRDGVSTIERHGTFGADNSGIVTAALQGRFCQERPGRPIIGIARDDLGANSFGRRDIAAAKRTLRLCDRRRRLLISGRSQDEMFLTKSRYNEVALGRHMPQGLVEKTEITQPAFA